MVYDIDLNLKVDIPKVRLFLSITHNYFIFSAIFR